MFRVTREWIHRNSTTDHGGWTKRQLELIGVRSFSKGWLSKAVGREIDERDKATFESIGRAQREGRGYAEPNTSRKRKPPRFKTDPFLASYAWRKLRMEVIAERGPRCECCGAEPTDGATRINVDHIQPRKTHPELSLVKENLQILCHVCNHGKGNWNTTDWRPDAHPDRVEPCWSPRLVKHPRA